MWGAVSRRLSARPRAAIGLSLSRVCRPSSSLGRAFRTQRPGGLVRFCSNDSADRPPPSSAQVVDGNVESDGLVVDEQPLEFPDLMALGIGRRPLLPGIIHPFKVTDPNIVAAIEHQVKQKQLHIGVFLLHDTADFSQEEARGLTNKGDAHKAGALAKVINMFKNTSSVNDGTGEESWTLLLQGMRRLELTDVNPQHDNKTPAARYLAVDAGEEDTKPMRIKAQVPTEKPLDSKSDIAKAFTNEIMSTIKEILKLNPLFKEQLQVFIERVDATRPAQLSDFACTLTTADSEELQVVLETLDVQARVEKTLVLLKQELELNKLQHSIGKQVEEKISKDQRKYLLTQQLKKIKQELGIEKDEKEGVIERYQGRLDLLENIPDEAAKVIKDEMAKLESLDPSGSEYNVVKNYLDWMTLLPWGTHSEDSFDVAAAKDMLDADHYGMDDLKERILEFIAMGSLRGDVYGKILILHGPPGVGKTSIGSSIGKALNREFFRFSVGGMSDVSEIKGHRRTYVGAMPGKLIQCLKKTQKANPVIMIDEIDKMGAGFRGDPSAALLEVLDPEQNSNFMDHYLDVPFDLSRALFVCTANELDTISRPLLDRMEVLSVSGYVLDEKLEIAKQYLLPRALKDSGLNEQQVEISKGALTKLIRSYCREAGVRNLQKQIEKIHRKVSLKVVRDKAEQVCVTEDNLHDFVGKEIFTSDRLYDETPPGVVMGLAYTQMGGATLYIETIGDADEKKNTGTLQTTGRMGEVMKESSSISHTYAQQFLRKVDKKNKYLESAKLHMHIPEGAVPKDGPSAGVTMTTSLLSLALERPVRKDLAMTGELTLTGKVLPVGGIKEKTIAAKRSGVSKIILPEANQRDFEELPDYIKEGMEVHYASMYKDVFDLAFDDTPVL